MIQQTLVNNDPVEVIKQKRALLEVVSDYVQLERRGKSYVGLCPFHKEKTPSFVVNPGKQFYYCFGCIGGGDIFTFIMRMNNVSFLEAARFIADRLGITNGGKFILPKRKDNGGTEKPGVDHDIQGWRNGKYNRLAFLYHSAHKLVATDPESWEDLPTLYHQLPVWEHYLDILLHGSVAHVSALHNSGKLEAIGL